MSKKSILVFLKNNLGLTALLFLGTLTWSVTMVKSGVIYPFGMGFWGANGHDGIWHIALIQNLLRGLPVQAGNFGMPVFAGHPLQNYHLGFDLLAAFLVKATLIPVVNLYFQILPTIFALVIGLLVYRFIWNWRKSKKEAIWAVFFIYFAGSWGWVLGKGESTFWSQQAISTLINPPFALSLIFILLGLICFLKFEETKKTKFFVLCTLYFGLLVEIKVYAGLLVLGALLVTSVHQQITSHKSQITYVFIGSLMVSLVLFFSFTRVSGSSMVWQPFWFLETMMGLTDRLGWLKFHSAMTTYRMGGIWVKAIMAYGIAFFIFIVGNLGTRVLALRYVPYALRRKLTTIDVFILSIVTAGMVIPIFFLQRGTPWNTIQFFYYSLFFSGILAGVILGSLKKNNFSFAFLAFIFLITIPTTIITLKNVYLPSRPPAMISNEELSALSFLQLQPDGIVLTYPFDKVKAKEAESNPPRPLYLYESTAYVSAFSGKTTFLEDEVNLDITGYDWKTRKKEVEDWYKEPNQEKAREFLKKNNIKYIYWLKGQKGVPYGTPQRAYLGEGQLGLGRIFENSKVDIWKVRD